MNAPSAGEISAYILPRRALDELFHALRRRGFRLLGPVVRESVITYDEISSAADLPIGWTDVQEAGSYRLERRGDEAVFGYNVGPQGWKRWLFPPSERLAPAAPQEPLAFIGVRACELQAIAIQDRVLMDRDPSYAARRSGVFIVAVNCGQSAATCFCVSMSSGPGASSGYDLAITELLDGEHRFLVDVGSSRGAAVIEDIPAAHLAAPSDAAAGSATVSRAAQTQVRAMPGGPDLRDLVYSSLEHPRWDDVADRCLSCGNCTMVCPTCFCFSISDSLTELASGSPERQRSWDSCFTLGHSYQHGGPVRASVKARYRQWFTHKMATWYDQFDTQGCVGCGRCIAWCPVGIDVTEEAAALGSPAAAGQQP
jgi:sulfhydrogenase subunit beta (sulfur reductase)